MGLSEGVRGYIKGLNGNRGKLDLAVEELEQDVMLRRRVGQYMNLWGDKVPAIDRDGRETTVVKTEQGWGVVGKDGKTYIPDDQVWVLAMVFSYKQENPPHPRGLSIEDLEEGERY